MTTGFWFLAIGRVVTVWLPAVLLQFYYTDHNFQACTCCHQRCSDIWFLKCRVNSVHSTPARLCCCCHTSSFFFSSPSANLKPATANLTAAAFSACITASTSLATASTKLSLLPVMSAYSMSLLIVLVLAAATQTTAQTALSAWMPGVATNYGGPSEGMDPNAPSYGLSNVSHIPITLACLLTCPFICTCLSTCMATFTSTTPTAAYVQAYCSTQLCATFASFITLQCGNIPLACSLFSAGQSYALTVPVATCIKSCMPRYTSTIILPHLFLFNRVAVDMET